MLPIQFMDVVMEAANDNSEKSFRKYAKKELSALIKSSNDSVYECFFSSAPKSSMSFMSNSFGSELAVRYVSMILAASSFPDLSEKITTASYDGISQAFNLYADNVGSEIFHKMLRERTNIPEDFSLKRKFFNEIADFLCKDYSEAVIKLVCATKTQIPVQLMLSGLYVYDLSAYSKVRTTWINSSVFVKTAKDYDFVDLITTYPWLEEYKAADMLSSEFESSIKKAVEQNKAAVTNWVKSPVGPMIYGLYKI